MKLYYNNKHSDPIYYIQDTIRTPKGPRSIQVKRIGKHSELLQITDDPLSYAQKILEQMNAETENSDSRKKVVLNIDLEKKVEYSKPDHISSQSAALNIGYFYIHYFYAKLKLDDFFEKVAADRTIPFDCNYINRFLTYDQILNPSSNLQTDQKTIPSFYERPKNHASDAPPISGCTLRKL